MSRLSQLSFSPHDPTVRLAMTPGLGAPDTENSVRYGSIADRNTLIQHVRLLADFGRDATLGLSPLGANGQH